MKRPIVDVGASTFGHGNGRFATRGGLSTGQRRTSDGRRTGGHSSDADILRHSEMGGGAAADLPRTGNGHATGLSQTIPLRTGDGRASVRLGQAQTCQDGRRQIARHTDWKRTGGALGITRVDACAPFGFGLRRIFPPKAFAFFGTSTTNTHNGLHTDARRTFPIAQAPHRARRSPRALIKSTDKAKENPGTDRGFLFAFYSCHRKVVGMSVICRRRY